MLEYRENHIRDQHGTLVAVIPQWTGEAEFDARVAAGSLRSGRRGALVVTATGRSPAAVWAELRRRTAAPAGESSPRARVREG
jgi:hypothetical protein